MSNKFRADYGALAQIAKSFANEASNTRQTLNQLRQQKDGLQSKDWIGKGADKFYGEMDTAVMPMLNRLINALETAQRITTQISQIAKQAEEEASGLLRGQGVGAGSAGAGGASGGAGGASGGAGGASGGSGGSSGGSGGSSGGASGGSGGSGGSSGGSGGSGGAASTATSRMLSQFDPKVQEIAAKSPTLQSQLEQLERNGWTIVRGRAGGGSFADQQAKRLTIDPSGSVESQVATIAHEGGHALYGEPPYHPPTATMTRDQYIQANVQEQLRNEGAAQLNAAIARNEINGAGGPDIGIPGTQTAANQRVYENFHNGSITRDQAIDQMANLMGNETTSTTHENYRTYYGHTYENHWDTHVAPTRRGTR